MDIMSADYADTHFPCQLWDAGQNGLTISLFEWNKDTKIMLYGQRDYAYGDILTKPVFAEGDPTRLYHLTEIESLMEQRGMRVVSAYGKFDGTLASENEIQLRVYSQKA